MSFDVKLVKQLREITGAGVMDCKDALNENNGDIEKAIEWLRKKGLKTAIKKSARTADEGIIDAYIHPGNKIGVLIEVNCETDFVARTEEFISLVKNLAMQIAASNPLSISREDLDEKIIEKEKEIYRAQLEKENKPPNVIEKIVEGKLKKFYEEVCLLDQPYIKDPSKTVRDLITEAIAKIGENISIKRFARYQIGS